MSYICCWLNCSYEGGGRIWLTGKTNDPDEAFCLWLFKSSWITESDCLKISLDLVLFKLILFCCTCSYDGGDEFDVSTSIVFTVVGGELKITAVGGDLLITTVPENFANIINSVVLLKF